MRITSIELQGSRTSATLKMAPAGMRIEAEIPWLLSDGPSACLRPSRIEFPIQDLRAEQLSPLARKRAAMRQLWRDRNKACEELADLLEGDRSNWKSYLAVIEYMAALG